MSNLDFDALGARLLADALNLLPRWLPGGKLIGNEYSCGSLLGEPGYSLKVNIHTGKWADFAGTDKGGDLISLYAAIQNIGQGEAFKALADDPNFQAPIVAARPKPPEVALCPPPPDELAPDMTHREYGQPSMSWCYRDGAGAALFYIARYDTPNGKQIVPWSWMTTGRWVSKGWPAPRPLYGLDQLALRPEAPVLIVEGEKAAEAAAVICGAIYVVVTWPNGGKAVNKTDWTPIYGRKVLIWPDEDVAGAAACGQIAGILAPHCQEVKYILTDLRGGEYEGYDAADALAEGWTWEKFKAWAKPRAEIFNFPSITMTKEPGYEDLSKPASDAPSLAVALQVNTEEANGPVSESQFMLMQRLGIPCTGAGQPICNVTSALRVIEGIPEYRSIVWFDEFHKRYFTTWRTGHTREWTDIDDLNLTMDMQRDLGLHRMSDETIAKAVRVYAHTHIKNEPRDWMDSLVWDGTDRIQHFLVSCMGVDDSPYARAASRNFWIGMVARIYKPGCQLDNMIVLEGTQGIGKTRALRCIGGEWYTSAKESVNRNDFFLTLHGKLVVEIAELDSFNRAEITRIKQVVSDPSDRYRSPYDRRAQDHARMSIFVGTTNEENYLRDATGGRRFWPVRCTEVNVDFIAKNRVQFFAEAVHRFKAGETWYEMPFEATKHAQESRRQVDEWEHIINAFLTANIGLLKQQTTITEIAQECLKIDLAKLDKATQMRIANNLKSLGWTKRLAYRPGDRRASVWEKREEPLSGDSEF